MSRPIVGQLNTARTREGHAKPNSCGHTWEWKWLAKVLVSLHLHTRLKPQCFTKDPSGSLPEYSFKKATDIYLVPYPRPSNTWGFSLSSLISWRMTEPGSKLLCASVYWILLNHHTLLAPHHWVTFRQLSTIFSYSSSYIWHFFSTHQF